MLSFYLEDSVCLHPFIFKKTLRLDDNFHETNICDITKRLIKTSNLCIFQNRTWFDDRKCEFCPDRVEEEVHCLFDNVLPLLSPLVG